VKRANESDSIPSYTIEENPRAKHVRFKISLLDGLVVVIPRGFDRRQVPRMLRDRRIWLTRALDEVERRRSAVAESWNRPTALDLPAVGQTWRLKWQEMDRQKLVVDEPEPFVLRVRGPIHDAVVWHRALRTWLSVQARDSLVPWAEAIAREQGITLRRIVIRCQRTRWGSYSTQGTVSLNLQLLFLPRSLAGYVLTHEICHARHPNHSPQFWRALEQIEPSARRLQKELRDGWKYVPLWLLASMKEGRRVISYDLSAARKTT
jgi:predicted metal-dependent hydrolase